MKKIVPSYEQSILKEETKTYNSIYDLLLGTFFSFFSVPGVPVCDVNNLHYVGRERINLS